MDRKRGWLTSSYGKKLKSLHAWNAWIVLLLAVSGIMLYIPELRGKTALFRVGLKELHIVFGLVSLAVLFLYLPFLAKHVRQIWRKRGQLFNLSLVLALLAGWGVSGLVLWQHGRIPENWSNVALFWHDLLTLIGVPWAIFHAVTRSRWLRSLERAPARSKERDAGGDREGGTSGTPAFSEAKGARWSGEVPVSRRVFLRSAVGLILAGLLGPYIYRGMKWFLNAGITPLDEFVRSDANRMIPAPVPSPDSKPPIGGGSQGMFRVFTVTEIPSFRSDDWTFTVDGLVKKPAQFNWEQFLRLERKVQVSHFHCVTGWSVFHVTWEGVPLSRLLDMAETGPDAKFVKFYSGDGVYTDCLPLEEARADDVIVAVMLDGNPIPNQLGGPVRLIVPQKYAYKSVKWLQRIELIDYEHIGYWEQRGYDKDAVLPLGKTPS